MQLRNHDLAPRLLAGICLGLLTLTGCSLDGSSGSSDKKSDTQTASGASSSSGAEIGSSSTGASDSTSSGSTVLAIGDSITSGYGVSEGYPSKLGRIIGKKVVAAGNSGENTSGGAGRISGLMDKYKPSTVVILEGTNDANRSKSATEAAANLGKIIDVAKSKGAKTIVLCTVPPLTGPKASKNVNVKELNGKIKSLAGSKGVRLADINAELGSGTLQSDGIHPNSNGHAIIAVVIAEKL